MAKIYTITSQQPTTYLDNGQVVSGYLVTARLTQWNEIAQVNVPSLDPQLIDARIRALIDQRTALEQLGS